MKISTEQFDEVKQFALHHNIESFLTSLDAPMGEFSFNRLNEIPVGERFVTHGNYIHPLLMKTLAKDQEVIFSAKNYYAENNIVIVCGQDFRPNEAQLNHILNDDFGAITAYSSHLNFLNKQEYELKKQILQEKKNHVLFQSEYSRINTAREIYKDFSDLKAISSEYGLSHMLEQWGAPLIKPVHPENTKSPIKLSEFAADKYFSILAKGCEISTENFVEYFNIIEVGKLKFKPTKEQIEALRADNYGYIFELDGFQYFSTKAQVEAGTQFCEKMTAYQKFEQAIKDTKAAIEHEIYADECKAQHEVFLKLPFPYYVAIKVNVRRLTEQSRGDGAAKNTVRHIVPEVEIAGRLKRKANEYLCGGKSSYGTPEKALDAVNIRSRHGIGKAAISCKSCLDIANRMLQKTEA